MALEVIQEVLGYPKWPGLGGCQGRPAQSESAHVDSLQGAPRVGGQDVGCGPSQSTPRVLPLVWGQPESEARPALDTLPGCRLSRRPALCCPGGVSCLGVSPLPSNWRIPGGTTSCVLIVTLKVAPVHSLILQIFIVPGTGNRKVNRTGVGSALGEPAAWWGREGSRGPREGG